MYSQHTPHGLRRWYYGGGQFMLGGTIRSRWMCTCRLFFNLYIHDGPRLFYTASFGGKTLSHPLASARYKLFGFFFLPIFSTNIFQFPSISLWSSALSNDSQLPRQVKASPLRCVNLTTNSFFQIAAHDAGQGSPTLPFYWNICCLLHTWAHKQLGSWENPATNLPSPECLANFCSPQMTVVL